MTQMKNQQEGQALPQEEQEAAPAQIEPSDTEETVDLENGAADGQVKLLEQQRQNVDLMDRLQRVMAEFDNFRKRTLKEKASMYDDGVRDALEKLLPVTDNLERALASASAEDQESGLYKGIEMTFRQWNEIIEKMGIAPAPGEGEAFDPNVHNAVAHVEDDALGESVIAEVLQKGYIYKDKVLRPSMVKVAN